MTRDDGLVIRRATAADRPAVIELLAASLGRDADPRYEALYAWKHEENPFGASPAWVACDGEVLAGFRVLMRWRFRRGAERVSAVRAVDTATHPDYQGRGIFTRLTLQAIEELRPEGVAFVFNTPNDQSRPGYLKMGWEVVGRPPTAALPRGPRSAWRMLRSRTPADRWSAASAGGVPITAVLAQRDALGALLSSQPPSARLRTDHDVTSFAWRYGTPLLGYRAVVARGGVGEGVAVFRVRERGAAREAALCEVLARRDDARVRRALVRKVLRAADADYVLRLGRRRDGLAPLPGQGPVLTWRSVAEASCPALDAWDLTLGDVELF